jgi:hypothetical protein
VSLFPCPTCGEMLCFEGEVCPKEECRPKPCKHVWAYEPDWQRIEGELIDMGGTWVCDECGAEQTDTPEGIQPQERPDNDFGEFHE